MIFFRFAVSLFAILLILFGLVWTISPIPFGIVFLFLGFLLLLSAAPGEIRWLRKRWRWFDRVMHGLEKRLPNWMARRLRDTDYKHEGGDDAADGKNRRA